MRIGTRFMVDKHKKGRTEKRERERERERETSSTESLAVRNYPHVIRVDTSNDVMSLERLHFQACDSPNKPDFSGRFSW